MNHDSIIVLATTCEGLSLSFKESNSRLHSYTFDQITHRPKVAHEQKTNNTKIKNEIERKPSTKDIIHHRCSFKGDEKNQSSWVSWHLCIARVSHSYLLPLCILLIDLKLNGVILKKKARSIQYVKGTNLDS